MSNSPRRVACAVGALAIAAAALSGCAATSTSDSSSGGASGSDTASNVATDDYTPHVKQGTPVVVDNLTWRVQSAYTASTLGSSNEFAKEDAKGTFVVVAVSVKNNNKETANITSGMIKLISKGREYETSSKAELALVATDTGEPFLLEDVGPDLTQDGTAAFDVPTSGLKPAPEICFGEMGFGPSRGCIELNRIK